MDKHSSVKSVQETRDMRAALLTWYDTGGRSLPWRIRPEDRRKGRAADPYAVWLSEIMLQQTTTVHAAPYWEKFLERFPAVEDLARADRDEVLAMWAGLGYYARARNLHKCALSVTQDWGGIFPKTEAQLLTLPGIGPYTAATIAAICYGEATNIVDGNVERVISRIFAVQAALPKARAEIRRLAGTLADPVRPGDYGQALMDLGATLCAPQSPKCGLCVWRKNCAAFKAGDPQTYPKKTPKKKQPKRYGAVFVLFSEGHVLLQRRADNGLLGGMMGFPGTEWTSAPLSQGLAFAPEPRNWELCAGEIKHVFTHFNLYLQVYRAEAPCGAIKEVNAAGDWADLSAIKDYALPTVFAKVLRLAQKEAP